MEIDKKQAVLIHSLIYTICYDVDHKTKKVDKVLKQIRKGVNTIDSDTFSKIKLKCHDSWGRARQANISKEERVDVKMSSLLMGLHNGIPLKYRDMYYTDRSFTAMTCSFDSCLSDRADEYVYTQHALDLANSFLDEIGVVRSTLLTRMRLKHENNLILEGKR